ncbi:kinase-like protein [Auricularia subglabra TFB-10046 SS5]|nr:kinase-like protein [Auricularia subglabra TFB-10046 SS5]
MRLDPTHNSLALPLPWTGFIVQIRKTNDNGLCVTTGRMWHLFSTRKVVLRQLGDQVDSLLEGKAELHSTARLARDSRKVHVLGKLTHPNVQSFLGICSRRNPFESYAVSEYINGLPVLAFLGANASVDRRRMVLQLAHALAFLHDKSIVHGTVCADNVCIAPDGRAVLMGLDGGLFPQRATTDNAWIHGEDDDPVPEPPLFDELQKADDPQFRYRTGPTDLRHVTPDGDVDPVIVEAARASLRSGNLSDDVFSFGIMVIEIFTSIGACSTPSALRILRMALKAQRPPHPGRNPELRGLDDTFWALCLRCWRLPGLEAVTMDAIVATLDRPRDDIIVCPVGWSTRDLLTWVDAHVQKFKHIEHVEVEPSPEFEDVNRGRVVVRQGLRKIQARAITYESLRRLRSKFGDAFYGEVIIWQQMRHPNVLPLLGIHQKYALPALVVPWLDGGHCADYLRDHPAAHRLNIAKQIAAGLNYMHTRTPSIAHGDVRARTVVMTADGVAQLWNFDFGPQQDPIESFDKSMSFKWGPVRNAAPDFVDSRTAHRTIWSDIWSFGMFMFELYSGHPPFHDIDDYVDLLATVKAGTIPSRATHSQLDDDIWALMLLCWRRRPMSRPPMCKVQARLDELESRSASFTRSVTIMDAVV